MVSKIKYFILYLQPVVPIFDDHIVGVLIITKIIQKSEY